MMLNDNLTFRNQKKFWIFDLDNTLYSPSTKIFEQIDIRMKKYISKKFNISEDQAFKIQKKMYYEYGTTLYGLMKFYKIDPIDFLNFVHDINLSTLKKSSRLQRYLNRLNGKKIVFTNGDLDWAKKIINALGVKKDLNTVFDIIEANYIPKPKMNSYISLIKKYNIKPKQAIFFEDTERNLKPAFKLGMTTVHIDQNYNKKLPKKLKPFVNFKFKCIYSALENINNF